MFEYSKTFHRKNNKANALISLIAAINMAIITYSSTRFFGLNTPWLAPVLSISIFLYAINKKNTINVKANQNYYFIIWFFISIIFAVLI